MQCIKINRFALIVLVLITSSLKSKGQYIFSTLANGQSAFLASHLSGQSFVSNPAFLGFHYSDNKILLQFEANTSETAYNSIFAPNFPDFELHIQLSSHWNFALRKQFGFPDPWFSYYPLKSDDRKYAPILQSFNSKVDFRFSQDWAYGIGLSLRKNISFGADIKHYRYYGTGISDEYLSFEFGSLYNFWKSFNASLVIRDLQPWRIKSSDRQFLVSDSPMKGPHIYRWNVDEWEDVSLKPETYVEFGLSYLFLNAIETLFDFSTRREYAWGLRIRFGKFFSIYGGQSNRYDHLMKVKRYKNASLGCQVNYKLFTFSVSGVWHQDSAYSGQENNKYGIWLARQLINDCALFSIGFHF